ncbi:MAG: SpoIIE family protein phosphatase [Thermoleophilaceae bacterium]|nr:SpoIIE family protein phosphatase [Thermoleophilaceae bacterium]
MAMHKDASQTLEPPPSPAALDAADLRVGGYVSVVMFAAGATLLPAIALPIGDVVEPVVVVVIGAVSLACAAVFTALTTAGRISRDTLYVGDYLWVGITAALVAASGGRSSPFFLLYPLPVLHAAAFQSSRRMTAVTAVATLAFLTPFVYDSGDTALFLAVAVIAVPPTFIVAWSLNAALTALRRQRRELAALAETVSKLQRITDVTLGYLSLDELLPGVLARIVDVVHSDAAAVLMAADDHVLRASCTVGLSGLELGAPVEAGAGLPGRVARTRRAITTAAAAEDDPISRAFAEQGAGSLVGVPLTVDDRMLGVLVVGAGDGRELGPVDTDLFRLAADRLALAIQRAQLYEREHLIAQTFQRSLLPERLPDVPGLSVAARYLPAREEAKVGGDWYDVLELPRDSVGLVMGDVVGHGIRAASTMAQIRSAIRAYALDRESPGEALTKLNTVVRGLGQRESATVVYVILDLLQSTFRFASAGHPPPLVIDPAGSPRFLEEGRSVPLGADAGNRYREAVARLEPGSTIVLYTDGLVERRGSSLTQGLERLASAAAGEAADPESLCDRLLGALAGDAPPSDDVALLAAHVVAVPDERLELELPCRSTTLAPLRRMLRHWLGGARASPGELQDILVAVSEAATNAIEHAYGPVEASYRVEGRRSRDRVIVTVTDSGSWRERRGAERGRGTHLMRELMDGFDLYPSEAGTVVRLERGLGSRGQE